MSGTQYLVQNETTRTTNTLDAIREKANDASTWGSDLVTNFANGMDNATYYLESVANNVATTINNFLGHSVPKKGPLREGGRGEVVWGEHLVQNIAKGMSNGEGSVMLAAQSLSESLADSISPELELDELRLYADRYVDEYRTMYDRVEQLAREHMDTMATMMKVSAQSYDFNATRAIDQALVSVSATPSVSIIINNPTVRSDRDIRAITDSVVDAIAHGDRYAMTGGRMR